MQKDWNKVDSILKSGGIAVIPTDTIYGIVTSALSKSSVEKVYTIRGRDEKKPCIVLVTSYTDLEDFGIKVEPFSFWPGKVSVVLTLPSKKLIHTLTYLHRGTDTIAFRMIHPRHKHLFGLIKKVGPLLAPSANLQGLPPARNITEAKKYFGNAVDMYVVEGVPKETAVQLQRSDDE